MIKKFCFLIFILLSFSTWCKNKSKVPSLLLSTVVKKNLPSFSQIRAHGDISIDLHTGYSHPELIIHADPRDINHMSVSIMNDTLFIGVDKGYPKFHEIHAEIRGNQLNKLIYEGRGTLIGEHLSSNYLDLYLNNEGKTTLKGSLAIRNITVMSEGYTEISGLKSPHLEMILGGNARVQLDGVMQASSIITYNNAWLGAYWLKSLGNLKIRQYDLSYVQLAGIANRVDIEMWGAARLNSQFLRAHRQFVKTHGLCVAKISTLEHQHTLATDYSTIEFYKTPKSKADMMAFYGAVLDFRNLGDPEVEEFGRYNK